MNVFGIGTMELLVILLVAFIALGPGKTMEVARTIGRMAREARRTFTDIMDAASVSDSDLNSRPGRAEPPAGTPAQSPPSSSDSRPPQPPTEPLPMPAHLEPGSEPAGPEPPADAGSDDAAARR